MIVLDTSVLSELFRPAPDRAVVAWLGRQPSGSLFTTTVTQAEIMLGIQLLPAGKRKRGLADAARAVFDEDFAERLLPFDRDAAVAYASIGASRRAVGRPISQFDAMIAALARSRGAELATRNGRDFEHCGSSPSEYSSCAARPCVAKDSWSRESKRKLNVSPASRRFRRDVTEDSDLA